MWKWLRLVKYIIVMPLFLFKKVSHGAREISYTLFWKREFAINFLAYQKILLKFHQKKRVSKRKNKISNGN